jgi:chemotaxis protein histidine kinase CheA
MDSVVKKWVRSAAHQETEKIEEPADETQVSADIPVSVDIPGVDTKKGIAFYGGDMNLYLPFLRSYASNTPNVLRRLAAVSKETLADYVIAVHGLKGTSAGIGAETIREAALNLEKMSRAGDLDGVLSQNGKLIKDTEIIVENINAWLEQYDAENAKPRLKAPSRELLAQLRQSCEKYDMIGIDRAMSELQMSEYEDDADLVMWLREKIAVSEIAEVAERLAGYKEEQDT